MTCFKDLPLETVTYIAQLVANDKEHASADLRSLSESCSYLRDAALPHLWHSVSLRLDMKDLRAVSDKMRSLACPSHPARTHGHRMTIDIRLRYQLENVCDERQLDSDLASAMLNLPHVRFLRINSHSPHFEWPHTFRAIAGLTSLEDLQIVGCMPVHLPVVLRPSLRSLALDIAYGACSFNLSCYPSLERLTLAMEDLDPIGNWDRLQFASTAWTRLETLNLRGYCRNPARLLDMLEGSLKQVESSRLTELELRLLREPDQVDRALELFKHNSIATFALTVPFLPDATFCRRLAQNFSDLRQLLLSGFCESAAWRWPDTSLNYGRAFADLKQLRYLSINHLEEEDGWDMLAIGEEEIIGPKYAYLPGQSGAARRKEFAQALRQHVPALSSMTFLPLLSGQ